jgi:hypothetical protein
MNIFSAHYLFWLWTHPCSGGHQRLCPQVKWLGCEAYCSRLRVSGAILTHPPCTFMACTGMVLPWPLYPGICQKLFQIRPWLLPSRSLAGLYLLTALLHKQYSVKLLSQSEQWHCWCAGSCLVCYRRHVNVWNGAKHNNVLPLFSPVPWDSWWRKHIQHKHSNVLPAYPK